MLLNTMKGLRNSIFCLRDVPYNYWRTLASKELPELTKVQYPNVHRGNYSVIDRQHLGFFKDVLGDDRVLYESSDCESYNLDCRRKFRGFSTCVVKPKTTEEVSKILQYCNQNLIAVCPQGGNTSLVGGAVPVFDEVVISSALMNNIISVDETSGILVCQAGCILENLENTLTNHGLIMPLDLGAKGSCHIGGNISTNAGGVRLVRYGNLHGNVLGLEAVLADGTVLDCMNTLKKDNTGYHLKHLFIGSEGTLGVVTKVAIQCPPKPNAINVAFLGLGSFQNVLSTFKQAKQELGEILSSFEVIDGNSLSRASEHFNVKSPIGKYPFYLLIETQGCNSIHDEEKLHLFLEKVIDNGTALNGTTSNEPSKMKQIWRLRESVADVTLIGNVLKYDISLPVEKFYTVADFTKDNLKNAVHIFAFGHIGDGNVHLNIVVQDITRETVEKFETALYGYILSLKGSISAEHGIGFQKTKHIHYSKSQQAINVMRKIKESMDPNKILNPYKVLPL